MHASRRPVVNQDLHQNSSEKKCFTIDIRDVNNLGLSEFSTGAKNEKE